MLDIADIAARRHSCKAFDPARRIPVEQLEQLQQVLRLSPSSVNAQPWHVFVASSPAGRHQLVQAMDGVYAVNAPKILNASHVFLLCVRMALDDDYLDTLLAQEAADGRLSSPEATAKQQATRSHYVNLHRELGDTLPWLEKQVYIALGGLLSGAAALGIDACPIEGFDNAVLDELLDLPARGLHACVMVALGYRSEDDFNAKLPKSRLPLSAVLTEI